MGGSERLREIGSGEVPLAVDLDGTLIRSDTLEEAMVRQGVGAPWRLLAAALLWMVRGRAAAKAWVCRDHGIRVDRLPYDSRVLVWLEEERRNGRILVLATGTDRKVAQDVADHLKIFDAVHASDGQTNLTGKRKAERLAAEYPGGFDYAGNSRTDLRVWERARAAVVVNASATVARKARELVTVTREFPRTRHAAGLGRAMRPHQWVKNLLVAVPILTGQGWGEAERWPPVGLAFLSLCLLASAVYLCNDVVDIEADRAHPRKRKRPFASGDASPLQGLALAGGLVAGGLWLAGQAGVLPWAVGYVALTSVYSLGLKRVLLVDAFVLAVLYAMRILIGGQASGYLASDWLVAFSAFFFLSLALGKRAAESGALRDGGRGIVEGRAYVPGDGPILCQMGVASGFVACLVLALYLRDESVAAQYAAPEWLWGVCGVALLWICRMWMLIARGDVQDDPVLFAMLDRWSWIGGAATLLCFLGASGKVPIPAWIKAW